ncbi:MAG: CorA family divalent cation transporter [Gammaproteobacteria bacterium]|nr:CorA family divalent cation transporter [Gammaproteobacteria bacterium]
MDTLDTTILEFDIETYSIRQLTPDELEINPENNKIYWIHCNTSKRDSFELLTKKMNLPEEIIQLCSEGDNLPRLIDSVDSLTIKIQGLHSTEFIDNTEVVFTNLIVHLTHKFCFTASSDYIPALFEFLKSTPKTIRYAKTPCFILFLICDNAINDYSKILFDVELVTEQMDIGIRTTHQNIYNKIISVKQQVMRLKHNTIAMREILVRISDRQLSVISNQCRSSLHNLSNHCNMVVNEGDSIREMLNGLLAQIDNALMQTMNQTMRVLTAFAAIFLPLSLITGIYGMNFQWIPELHWKYGYFYALGLLVVCACVLLCIFKKNKWF